MLTPLDDTLLHQVPTTFDHAGTSDHRFFDRWALGIQHETASVIYGLATYKNMNVCDGFVCVAFDDRQVNLRLSRPLRPDFAMGVGPLRIEVTEPLWAHRLLVEPTDASPLSCDLTWTGELPAREEHPHHLRRSGWAMQDYSRMDQLGSATGWVGVGDRRIELDGTFAWRDHAWGVRPGVGGWDPPNQPTAPDAGSSTTRGPAGTMFFWIAFRAGNVAGQLQFRENGDGEREHIDGHLLPDTTDPATSLSIADVRHRVAFVDGHTAFERADFVVTTGDGREWQFEAVPLRPPWAYCGGGYSGGWVDGLGLGAPRGVAIEADEYRYAGPADLELPDGTIAQPWHRETDVRLSLNGTPGDGHLTIIARPPLPPATF